MFHLLLTCLVISFPDPPQEPAKEPAVPPAVERPSSALRSSDRDRDRGRGESTRTTSRGTFEYWPFARPDSSSPLSLSTLGPIQDELKLSAEQKQAITDLTKKLREEQVRTHAEISKQARDANQEAEKKIRELLDEKQAARIDQLRWQRLGTAALLSPEMAEKLSFTDEQREKMGKLAVEYRSMPSFSFGGAGGTASRERGGTATRESSQLSTRYAENRQRVETQILEVLTAEQRSKWESLLGERFSFPQTVSPFNETRTNGRSGIPSSNFTLRVRSRRFQLSELSSTSQFNRPISMRSILGIYGPAGPFRYKATIDALQLTDEQANQIQAIGEADVKAIEELAKQEPPVLPEVIAKLNEEARAKIENVLTDVQKIKWKELTSQ